MQIQKVPALAVTIVLMLWGFSSALAQTSLCEGLVSDRLTRPMTFLAKPSLFATTTDPEFGTLIRRISAVPVTGADPAIRPMYSTTSAWNADESLLILYQVGAGHRLHDGRTYEFIRHLDIRPADLEQVYWDMANPHVLHYVDGRTLVRYHVLSGEKEPVRTFSFCVGNVRADSHAFTSWDSEVVGLSCDGRIFGYDMGEDVVSPRLASSLSAPMAAPSGNRFYFHGYVLDKSLRVLRSLDVSEPDTHSSLGRNRLGRDVWNGAIYDPGPRGSPVGSLVSHDLADGSSRAVIGPSTGFPYPPSGTHISSLAYRAPGWVFVSIVGNPAGRDLLHNEVLLANVDSGEVCRLGHHRTFGKNNTRLSNPYWAEPHVTASPTGTRALIASDWGNGSSVDSYVFELPSYRAPTPGLTLSIATNRTSYRRGQTMLLSLVVANVGETPDVDLYFGVVRPGGSPVVFFDNWSFHQTVVNPSTPANWPPIAAGAALPHTITVDLESIYRKTWGGSDPTGTHQFLFFAVRKGSLGDGRFDSGDLLASDAAPVSVTR